MRKNTQAVIAAALVGKPCRKCEAIWTNGMTIWSYQTMIAYFSEGKWHVNSKRYSQTTTIHQNGLVSGLERAGYEVIRY